MNADSDIDIGIDYDGNNTWAVSGSVHMGQSTSTKITGSTHNFYDSYVRTNFQYQHMHYINSACPYPANTWRIYAIAWNAGISDDGKYPGHNCAGVANRAFVGVGQTHQRTSSRASKITLAVGIGAARLGQTSGHSVYVDLYWSSITNRGIYICGADGTSVTTAGVLYVSNL